MNWGFESPPTTRERDVLELQRRYNYATRLLGVNETARLVFRTMLLFGGSWSVSALSDATSISRSAVRDVLTKGVGAGCVRRVEARYQLAAQGRGVTLRIHREAMRIAVGEQVGFSLKLIHFIRDNNLAAVDMAAAKVRFPKNKSMKTIF